MEVPHRRALAGLPDRSDPWQTAWKRHAAWPRNETWDRVWRELQAQADADGQLDWLVAIDSSIARVHQHAAALSREQLTGGPTELHVSAIEPPDRAIGRSRGGLTTKSHMACDGQGRPLSLSLWVTGGNVNDVTERPAVMAGIRVPNLGPAPDPAGPAERRQGL